MFDVSRDEITEGSLPRALVYIATPIVVQQYVVVLQQVVDVFWLGRVSEEAVAAVGLVAPLVGLLNLGSHLAYTGGQVLVAQNVGAGDEAAARRAGFHAVVLVAALNLLVAVAVFFLADDLVGLFAAGEAVLPLAATYLVVTSFGRVFSGMSDAIEAGFVGVGDSRTSLVVNATTVAVNVALDPFLVVGWGIAGFDGYGVFGAALATSVGYVAGFLLAAGATASARTAYTFTRADLGLRADTLRALLDVGLPKVGQEGGRQVARLLMVAIVAGVGGGAGLAAYTVGMRVSTLAFVPAIAVGSAVASVVGQNVGAANPARATRATWLAAGVTTAGLAVVGAVQFALPAAIADLFAPSLSGVSLSYTVAYLEILALGYWAFGVIYPVQGGFNGAGETRVSMVATMLQYWGVRLPVAAVGAYALALAAPVHAAFWAITLSNVAGAVGVAAYFRHATDRGLLDRAAADASAGGAD